MSLDLEPRVLTGSDRDLPPHPPENTPGGMDLSFRPDIEGLRAVAVTLVVIYHVHASWLRSGFVGVDVFFVISGFLITGLLIKEQTARGRLSILGFYARRTRRILPAAMTVIVITVVASYFIQNFNSFTYVAQDGRWASLFATNFHFWKVGIDYSRLGSAPSPLLHYWSLAVEEQFYLVWPLALLAIAMCAREVSLASRSFVTRVVILSVTCVATGALIASAFVWHFKLAWLIVAWVLALVFRESAFRSHQTSNPTRQSVVMSNVLKVVLGVGIATAVGFEVAWDFRSVAVAALAVACLWRSLEFRWRVLGVASVAVVVSLIWSIQQTSSYPTWAYFSPFTRAWELGVGAMIAALVPTLRRLPTVIGIVVAWLGVGAIGLSAFLFADATKFPGSEALWPVLGAGAVIAGGCASVGAGHLLGLRPIRSVGRVSYGWYLLHYPFMIILTGAIFSASLSAGENSIIAIVTLALAYFMYWALERPIRRSVTLARSPWLSISVGEQFVLAAFLLCLLLHPGIHQLWFSNWLP